MRLNMDWNLFAGGASYGGRAASTDMFGRKMQKNGSFRPASLLTGSFDPIEQKRAMAQKKAYQIVSDTFAGDRKLDEEFADHTGKIDYYKSMMSEANQQIREIDQQKAQLRQEYGVEPDSQEQKDLELLERYQQNPMEMTKEEWDRVGELNKEGLTDYQKEALSLNSYKDPYQKDLTTAKKEMIQENAVIRAMTLERLKKNPMVKASQEAEEVLENASKEITSMLLDEAVDNIDEKFEEEIEKTEERKEEKKEEKEKLEEARERREEMEALADPEKAKKETHRTESETDALSADPMTEAILKMDGIKNDVKQEISDMMTKMKLVAEDLKGIKVDELL